MPGDCRWWSGDTKSQGISNHGICFSGIFHPQHQHDDVIKWKHFFTLLALCAGNSPVTGEFPSQRHGALMFSLICAWTNAWVNNRDAGDLGRHHAHYDVSVLKRDVSVCRCHLTNIGTPITKIGQFHSHHILIMGITIPGTYVEKWHPIGLNKDNTCQNAWFCLRQSHNVATLLTLFPEIFHPQLQMGWIKTILTRGLLQ